MFRIKVKKMDLMDLKYEALMLEDKISELVKSAGQISDQLGNNGAELTNRVFHDFNNLMRKYKKEEAKLRRKLKKLNNTIKDAQLY